MVICVKHLNHCLSIYTSIKKYLKRRSSSKTKTKRDKSLFLCFVAVAIFLLYASGQDASLNKGSISSFKESSSLSDSDLFISQENDFSDFEELTFIHNNSILASSAPYFVNHQILGTRDRSETRKGMISHKVEEGDTIDSIAERFNITGNTIRWANDIKGNALKIGDELLILPISGALYYVERGDTVGTIAEKHKTEVEEVISFNNLEREKNGNITIIPGQLLIIPGGTPPPQPTVRNIANTSFINPVPGGRITQGIHFYNAVDIYNPCGSPILSSAPGRVTEVGYGTWPAGNFVKIDHGSVVILYAHMQSIYVRPGSSVTRGQQIGTVGNTGYTIGSTGCHLHFDVLSRQIRNPLAHYKVGTIVR